MKMKKEVRFQDDQVSKVKQPSKIKKKHLLKVTQFKNVKSGMHKRPSKPNIKFKKGQKKSMKKWTGDKNSDMPRTSSMKFGRNSKLKKMATGKSSAAKNQVTGKTSSDCAAEKEVPSRKRKTELEMKSEADIKRIKLCEMKPRERKKLRREKKSTKEIFNISVSAKKIWEILRRDDCNEDKKKSLLSELLNLIKGHVKELIFAHDTARVIECVIAAGSTDQRNQVFNEVKDHIVLLAKSKYAKFFLIKILNYGTKEQKDCIVNSFKGQVVSLVKHSEASAVVEAAYNEYANAKQRAELVQEFYGPTYMVFKDENARNLDDILRKHPDQKVAIISNIKNCLLKITEKSVIKHSIIHYILREFFNHADSESRSEVIESIRDAVVEMLHTKDGARVAMNCLWHGTVKDRKKVLKSMKMHVCKIAKEEHGSLVLIALFDCVDDTKLVQQIIINKLCENFIELADDVHARKVLLYLLSPRNSHFFHPDVVRILQAGDSNEHSKKSQDSRWLELKTAASPLLLKHASEHSETLLKTNATCLLLLCILQHASGDKKQAFESVASLIHTPFKQKVGNDLHPLEQPSVHFLIKKLLRSEVSKGMGDNEDLFSVTLATTVPATVMKSWIDCNRGAFILLDLLKSGVPSVVEKVLDEMKGMHKSIKSKNFKGAELLLSELKKHETNA